MFQIIPVIKTDLKRALISRRAVFSILLIIMVCFLSLFDENLFGLEYGEKSASYLFDVATTTMWGWFTQLVYILAVLPFGFSFCQDWNHRYIFSLISRSNVNKYVWSKVIVSMFSSFCVVFFSYIIVAVLLILRYPVVRNFQGEIFMEVPKPYNILLYTNTPFTFFIIRSMISALGASFWATFSYVVSSYIPNLYVTGSIPFVASYLIGRFSINFPEYINVNYMFNGIDIYVGGWYQTFFYILVITISANLLLGALFVRRVKRRVAGEVI